MNKIRALLSLLVLPTIGAQNIAATINSLQASNQGILDQDAFNDENSYQSQARAAALGTLRNPSELYIRNYYALACIYYATNGVSNKITDSILPGCPTLNWLTDDWLLPDYCTWFGITCNNETNVVQIELNENRLYGSWPNEVVLLKNHLEHINLFNNVYHYSEDPRWLAEMIELKYLYFGTTSWEYPGVPTYLGGARKLIEIDMSNTRWSDGPIHPGAFTGLNNLEHLDMGQNTWDTTNQTEFPTLPHLRNLYLDRCQFTPNRLTMRFLVNLTNIENCSMDFTQLIGSIPTGLGELDNLTSFSCTYCGLTGSIPTELGTTGLQELWLHGNDLTGTIPSELGGIDSLSLLYLEGNEDLFGSVPGTICNLTLLSGLGVDCTVNCTCCTCCGEDCGNLLGPTPVPSPRPTFPPIPTPRPTPRPTVPPIPTPRPTPTPAPSRRPTLSPIPTSNPTPLPTVSPIPTPRPTPTPAPSRRPTLSPIPTPSPTPRPTVSPIPTPRPTPTPAPSRRPTLSPIPTPSPTPRPTGQPTSLPPTNPPTTNSTTGFCFSGDCLVEVQNRGLVKMRNLAIGDVVKVADGKYEPIYSFGHKNNKSSAEFLQITTNTNRPLEISKDHMILLEGGRFVPASMVRKGDMLVNGLGELVLVQTMRKIIRKGVYAPFTQSGTLVVDNIVASNYIAYQDSEYLTIAGFYYFSYHWLAHTFQSVHRLAVVMGFVDETYTDAGVSHWVHLPHEFGLWLVEQQALVVVAILIPCISLFGFLSILEALVTNPITFSTFVVGLVTLLTASQCVYFRTTKR